MRSALAAAVNSFNDTEGTWAAFYEPGIGWISDSVVRLDGPGIGYPVGVSVDSAGNALAVWGPSLKFRRYVAGVGWLAASSLAANVDEAYVFAAGAADGSVLVVAHDLSQNANGIPMAVRFE
jgi:hypothetical protein